VQVADVRVVILRLSSIRMLDTTGAHMLSEVVRTLQRKGIVVLLKGMPPRHRKVFESVGVLGELQHSAHVFASLDEAVAHARSHVRRALDEA
ncbi:MAG: sodium-independent anion transporter, partial [Actinomycetota bacterium]|nr:sodium-independent anion transporter [Actinomycetota bacterium]